MWGNPEGQEPPACENANVMTPRSSMMPTPITTHAHDAPPIHVLPAFQACGVKDNPATPGQGTPTNFDAKISLVGVCLGKNWAREEASIPQTQSLLFLRLHSRRPLAPRVMSVLCPRTLNRPPAPLYICMSHTLTPPLSPYTPHRYVGSTPSPSRTKERPHRFLAASPPNKVRPLTMPGREKRSSQPPRTAITRGALLTIGVAGGGQLEAGAMKKPSACSLCRASKVKVRRGQDGRVRREELTLDSHFFSPHTQHMHTPPLPCLFQCDMNFPW